MLHARYIPYLSDMEYLNEMTNYFLPLQTGAFYHLYNRGNNGENIFYKADNYVYFLHKFDHYLTPYMDVYAYCLLPNHFQFLVRTKDRGTIPEEALHVKTGSKTLTDFSQVVSEACRRLFLSYAKAIKIQESRTGSLFEKNFKRKEVNSNAHLYWLINYIHRNPETHGIASDFTLYPHSSYKTILSNRNTKVKREAVLSLFSGQEEFVRYHAANPVLKDEAAVLIE